jgi:hypothetical protein
MHLSFSLSLSLSFSLSNAFSIFTLVYSYVCKVYRYLRYNCDILRRKRKLRTRSNIWVQKWKQVNVCTHPGFLCASRLTAQSISHQGAQIERNSSIRWLLTYFGHFLKSTEVALIFGATFFCGSSNVLIVTKTGLRYILAYFKQTHLGHPVSHASLNF